MPPYLTQFGNLCFSCHVTASQSFFPADSASAYVSSITNFLSDNMVPILSVMGFVIGISVILALLSIWSDSRFISGKVKNSQDDLDDFNKYYDRSDGAGMTFNQYKKENPDSWDYEHWASNNGKDF